MTSTCKMKRFHFQVNTTVNYDIAEIEAESLEEAYEKMRWYWAQHKGYNKIVHTVKEEPNDDFNAFIGINAV